MSDTLSKTISGEDHTYSVKVYSGTSATSFEQAFEIFLLQLGMGHVIVEVTNDQTDDTEEIDDILQQSNAEQIALALDLIRRNIKKSTAHERISLLREVQDIIGHT